MPEEKKGIVISFGRGKNEKVLQIAGPGMEVSPQSVPARSGREVDLVFVIDTTGSMSDKIEGLLQTCGRLVTELVSLSLSHRIAVVAFGDLTVEGDKIVTFEFTEDVSRVTRTLSEIPRFNGGGNEGESSLEALETALNLPFRKNAVKAVLLITDEPALQENLWPKDLIYRLRQSETLAFIVSPAESYYIEMAESTGGTWYKVSAEADFTGLLEMFRKLAARLSEVVADVYKLGNGSVRQYLQLKGPGK